jgi:hypothetical protein
MSFLVPLIALLGAVFCGWVTVSHLVRMKFQRRGWALDWAALTLPLYGGACAACLTAAGLIGMIPGIIIAVVLLGTTAVLLADSWLKIRKLQNGGAVKATGRILAALRSQAAGGLEYIREDAADIAGMFRREQEHAPEPVPAPVPVPAGDAPPRRVVQAPGDWDADPRAGRNVPPVREDPHLGDPGQPEDIAEGLVLTGVAVPLAWAALAESIGSFEPGDEDDLFEAVRGDAAGALAVADAIRARADTLLHATGLDPAYVAGHADFADEFAALAEAVALVDRRYHVIYGTLRDAVANGMVLPHRAREFFGAGGGAQAAEGTGGEAAA